jgi:hypothetical protein
LHLKKLHKTVFHTALLLNAPTSIEYATSKATSPEHKFELSGVQMAYMVNHIPHKWRCLACLPFFFNTFHYHTKLRGWEKLLKQVPALASQKALHSHFCGKIFTVLKDQTYQARAKGTRGKSREDN